MSNIPKLRFPEFSGEWEEKKLSDFMTRLTRKNSNNESSRALTISSVDGLIDQGEFFKKQIASKDTSGYYLLKNGDFAYNKSYSVGYDYGSIKRLDRYEDGVVSTLYICMSLTSDTNSDYLTHYFDSMKWNKSVSEISAEGARNHGLLNIPTESFFQTKHFLAPTLAEQQKIADFLSNVDSIITTETKILNALQKKKKALMQKLFTQQLRFKSDDGTDFPAWEEKKLGECVNSFGDGIHGTPKYSAEGDYYFINGNNLENGKINITQDTKRITQEVYEKIKRNISDSSILISINGTIGKLALVNNERIALGKSAGFLNINENIDKKFIYYTMSTIDFKNYISNVSTGTTIKNLSPYSITEYTVHLPSYCEQQKISDYLSSMDSLIQNQQRVVTTWQQRKKALLQQMFI